MLRHSPTRLRDGPSPPTLATVVATLARPDKTLSRLRRDR